MYRTRRRRAAKRFVALQRKWRKYRRHSAPLRTQVKRLRKQVNKDIEHRWQDDINFTFSVPAAGGLVQPLGTELIAQGDDVADRTGNKINLKSVYIRGQLIVSDSHNFVRLLLVKVVSLNQIVIASDILQPDATTGNPTLYSPFRKESRLKFTVLKDKFYKLQEIAAGSVYPFLLNVDMSYKWKKGLTITYDQVGNSVPIYANIYLIGISDSQIVTHPTFRGSKRLTWIA